MKKIVLWPTFSHCISINTLISLYNNIFAWFWVYLEMAKKWKTENYIHVFFLFFSFPSCHCNIAHCNCHIWCKEMNWAKIWSDIFFFIFQARRCFLSLFFLHTSYTLPMIHVKLLYFNVYFFNLWWLSLFEDISCSFLTILYSEWPKLIWFF